ncbi:TRAP transporter small permease [Pseudooceanicola sp. C21-150M6]|uniref:TRAP transporter small permease n=1 Tax=Pseudooceanicola sp. C21-150M6 TaxID=3434355 RepID=UPI003D7FA366
MYQSNLLSFLRKWAWVELVIACALLVLIVLIIGYQIVARSAFGAPLVWAEEAAMFAFLWVVFLGAGLAAKLGQHIQVSALEGLGGDGLAVALNIFGAAVAGVALLYIGWLAYGFLPIEMRTTSIALPIDIPKAYFFSIPLIYSALSMTLSFAMAALIGRTKQGRDALQDMQWRLMGADHSDGVL